MTESTARELDASASCPLLGLPDDARTHYSFPHEGHRCYARPNPARIGTPHQAAFCVTSNFEACSWYVEWQTARAAGAGTPGASPTGHAEPGSGRVLAIADPSIAVGEWATGAHRGRRPGDAVAAVALLAFLLAAVVIGGSLLAGEREGIAAPVASGTPRPSPTLRAASSTAPSAAAATRPPSTVAPEPSAPSTPGPVGSASPSPGRPRTYVVQSGDWLSAIAERFGTTVERLAELNGIEDPDVLEVGRRLVLPPAGER